MNVNMLNVTLGMKGISEIAGKDMFSEAGGVSFNDVLNQVNAADEVTADEGGAVTEEGIVESGEVLEEQPVTFSELTTDLSEDVANAGADVICAAVKLLQSVGKAVEKLFGTGESVDMEGEVETGKTVTDVFGAMLGIVSENKEDDETNDALSMLFGKISHLLETGISEGMETADIVEELKNVLMADDSTEYDGTTLAEAVMTVLCMLSGTDVNNESFDVMLNADNVTAEAVTKLAGISDVISGTQEIFDNSSSKIRSIITGNTDAGTESKADDVIEIIDFMQNQSGVNFKDMMNTPVNNLRINNAADQLDYIRPDVKQTESNTSEVNVQIAVEQTVVNNVSVQLPAEEAAAAETTVYSELGEFVNVQLTERIVEEIKSEVSFNVKELTVVLKPESLGEVAVKVTADENGIVSLILAASNPEVNKAISENTAALMESFAKQNVRVEQVNVVNPSEASSYMGLDFTNQGFNRRNDNDGGSQSENYSGRNSVNAIGAELEAADEIRAQKLLKEAKLWATA